MRKSVVFSSILAVAACGQAVADTFSYNKVDFGLVATTIDAGLSSDVEGLGLGANGSWEFGKHVFGFGSISYTEFTIGDDDIGSATDESLGIGFNWPLGSKIDLIASGSYQRESLLDDEGYDAGDVDGYGLSVGVRGLAGKRFDWNAHVGYFDVGGGDGVSWGGGFRYMFTKLFGMGLELSASDSDGVSTGTAILAFRLQFNDRD